MSTLATCCPAGKSLWFQSFWLFGGRKSRFVHRMPSLKTPNAGQRKRIPGVKPARGPLGCSPCVPVSCLVFKGGQVS